MSTSSNEVALVSAELSGTPSHEDTLDPPSLEQNPLELPQLVVEAYQAKPQVRSFLQRVDLEMARFVNESRSGILCPN